VLKDRVGTVHTDWGAFLQAVRDVDIEQIKDGVDAWRKEQDNKEKGTRRARNTQKEDTAVGESYRLAYRSIEAADGIVRHWKRSSAIPTNHDLVSKSFRE
jgi:hypothetical protein